MNELQKKLNDLNIDLLPQWNTDKPVRKESQWFIGKTLTFEDHLIELAWFGDYRTGRKDEYKSELNGLGTNLDLQAKINAEIAKALAEEKAAREQVWLERAPELEKEFEQFSDRGPLPPYLIRKQIDALYGTRVAPNENGDPILVVPLRDVDGKFWNYQRIYSQRLSKGDKFFEKSARIEGCFHALNAITDLVETIYIAEGFATAASIHMALDHKAVVVCAFNAGNLFPVVQAINQKHPRLKVIVCADNDVYTVINDRPYNVGLEKGRRAAGVCQGEIRYPTFKHPVKGFTDFNDLHAAQGLAEVRDQILHAKVSSELEPMILKTNAKGMPKAPSGKQVSDYLLKFFDGRAIRQDKSIFLYSGTHWRELDGMGVDRIKQMIGHASQNTLDIREIKQAFEYFFTHMPQVPSGVDFYQPNPFAANFADGTLHLEKSGTKYKVNFKPHAREDFLTNVLPFSYPKPDFAPALRFQKMLNDLWATNADKKEVHTFIQELMGATLCPAFPIIALFQGRPNSGKSTIIKLLVRMMSLENVCSVQLCDMQGFNMETMVGKLLNFDTDIDTQRPMNDSEVKKIIDRVPRRVRRKGRTDIQSYLPAVHLFASNQLPKSLDGSSHAYGRRLVVIKTESFQAANDAENDFEKSLWETEADGILNFALAGLIRLASNGGKFTIPDSSRELVHDLENESDLVNVFLDEVKHNEVFDGQTKICLHEKSRIERNKLWDVFNRWQNESGSGKSAPIGKIVLYRRLDLRGIGLITVRGVRYFEGIGPVVQGDVVG